MVQANRDLDVGESLLRRWLKEFTSDPGQAFPGQGQLKPEHQEIDRLRREVAKLKAERDILARWRGDANVHDHHHQRERDHGAAALENTGDFGAGPLGNLA